jgi:hypothetical protein
MSQLDLSLPTVVRQFIEALNAGDEAALSATVSEDAFINDAQREFWGKADITTFARKELLDPKVTMTVQKARAHRGLVAVDAVIDGEFDKTGLPDPLILTFYFTVEDERIVTVFIMRNRPATAALIRPPRAG